MDKICRIIKISGFIVGLLLLVVLSSCRSSKTVLYNPVEVEQLSRALRIPINNDDPNIPLYAEASLWLGVPYRYGGNTKAGSDCSGFVWQVYRRVYGKHLERSSDDRKSKKIGHVGIFLKDGYFVHASTSKGVIVSSLEEDYYKRTWQKGGRVK